MQPLCSQRASTYSFTFSNCCVQETCITSAALPAPVGRSLGVWTITLQLYLASYCRPAVCKDLWNQIVSSQQGGIASYMTSEVRRRLSLCDTQPASSE